MQTKTKRLLFIFAIVTAVSAMSLFGQTFGEITGHISDSSGAAVAGAKVMVTNVATNAVRTALSTESGDYTFPSVPPGVYNIRVEQASFKTAGSAGVHVQVQQTVRQDFTLEVGQITELAAQRGDRQSVRHHDPRRPRQSHQWIRLYQSAELRNTKEWAGGIAVSVLKERAPKQMFWISLEEGVVAEW